MEYLNHFERELLIDNWFCFCFYLFAVKLSILPFIRAKIESFMCFFQENWSHVKITPKLGKACC